MKPGDRVLLGLSGGIDSVVLLDLLTRARKSLRIDLKALHVNHQLSPNAARWAAFCRATCRGYGVPCRVVKVSVMRANSVERAAREARYAELRRVRVDYIVLAHNLDDQAETVLLQLVRGAGVKGLAAMPFVREANMGGAGKALKSAAILRPLLDVPRLEIERYARTRKLEWIEDESNEDVRYTRNWVRREVLPLLSERLPAVRHTLARAAANMSEAAELLDELARLDGGARAAGGAIALEVLRALSAARAKNLLRFAISSHGWAMPTSDRLHEALRQALHARRDATVAVDLGACELRRHGEVLHLLPKTPAGPGLSAVVTWRGEEALALPGWGTLVMQRTRGRGLSEARLGRAPVTIRPRAGGERLQPSSNRPRRTVKNLLQEAGVPPWERETLPCIYSGETLACIPGLAIDYRFQARGGEPAVVPVWRAASVVTRR
ncbi:MAG: tRNA lysidine(34) synthetase TilS [Burkholderiales bacterium]